MFADTAIQKHVSQVIMDEMKQNVLFLLISHGYRQPVLWLFFPTLLGSVYDRYKHGGGQASW